MSDTLTAAVEQLTAEVRARMDAVDSTLSDATSDIRIADIVTTNFPNLMRGWMESPEGTAHVRKMRFGASEPKLLGSKYGRLGLTVSDVEMLHDITLAAHKRGLGDGPSEELRNCFAAVSEGRYEDTAVIRSRGHAQLNRMLHDGEFNDTASFERAMRAMDTAESGYGNQLVGAQYVHDLWRGAATASRVFGLFRSFDMTDPSAFLPVQGTPPVVKFVAESTVANAASYASTKTGSNRIQVDAKTFLMLQYWSYELNEDSLIPFMAFLREEAQMSWAWHLDSAILNGDTTNAATGNLNLDDANPADDSYYLAFDGLRHAGLVDNTANSLDVAGALTIQHLRKQRGRMLDTTYKHDWSHPNDNDDVVYVGDPDTVDAVSFFDEALTEDKIGARATVLTGQQARILNHPLIPSIVVSKTEADGKVSTTGSNNTKGQLLCFNRRGGVVGTRSQMQVETDRDITTRQFIISWCTRMGFGRFTPTGAASAIEHVDVLYDIDLT